MNRLAGKTALLTAAAAGIGRATAEAFAAEGARVIATDLNEAALAGLKGETRKLDVRSTEAVEALAREIGPIDVLFNCAGFVHHGTALECSDADFDFSFDLNVKSMHRTVRAFLPGMLAKGGGAIVNVASDAAKVPTPGEAVVGAAMAGIAMFSRTLAMEAKRRRIRVNVVTPSLVRDTQTYERVTSGGFSAKLFEKATRAAHLGLPQPDEVAAIIAFLAGPDAARMTGQVVSVNGGISAG